MAKKFDDGVRLDAVMLAFEKEDEDDILNMLINSDEVRQSFNYYRDEEHVKYMGDYILEAENDKKFTYIKNLVSVYPLTANILHYVMKGIKIKNMQEDVLEWFDISDTMSISFNKFKSVCFDDKIFDDKMSELEEKISSFESEKKKYENKRDQLNSKKAENMTLFKEVQSLKAECKGLESDSSKENLERQKKELTDKINTAKKAEAEATQELEKLKKELEKVQAAESKEFTRALNNFKKVMETLPKDEADK